jgi:hypothetical protein
MKPRSLPTLLSVLALAACASPAIDATIAAQRSLIGMPKAILLSCAGVPQRQTSADGLEFYTYTASRSDIVGGGVGWGGGYGYPYHWDYAGPPSVQTETCDATFTLRNGKVERLVYGGDGAYGIYGQCHAIVANCLPPPPPQP